ncbi:hypothetical protein ETD86_36130 [Nonomuraea turkmeniaca]|uniref:Secreted protein n=1 Tax=Nonomuraea turkmeniaca TaxID=103838 RepID=A0A5S4F538_9ACTN|nr:hypothetical protein [Nonomuraea turkmeniaca]TMR11313.1 hypothetical protein ETD86_36130 [Nonomuraea turkmeniaca]
MDFASQIVTIAAVVVGALTTYVVTALNDRSRHKREVARQWVDRKLQLYTGYAGDIKQLVILARQITALHGLHDAAPGVDEGKALALLDEAETRRSLTYEAVRMLGDTQTIRATGELNDAVHRLEWLARGKLDADPDTWETCWQLYTEAANTFHESVRRELGVPGAFLPRLVDRGAGPRPTLPIADRPQPVDPSRTEEAEQGGAGVDGSDQRGTKPR